MPIAQSRSLRPVVVTTTLDPNNKSSTIVLSNGNLTSTCITALTPEPQVFSVGTRSSGKAHLEVTFTNYGGSFQFGIGVGSLSNHSLTTYAGGDNFSVGMWFSSANVRAFGGNAIQTTYSGIGASEGDVIAFEIDISLSKIWVKNVTQGSGWNGDILANQDPATNTGGFDGSTWLGSVPLVICIGPEFVGGSETLNAGGSPFAMTPTTGFTVW